MERKPPSKFRRTARVIVALLAALTLLAQAGGVRAQSEADRLQRERREIETTIRNAERTLASLDAEIRRLRSRGRQNQAELERARRELQQAVNVLREQQARVAGVRQEVSRLGGEIQVTQRSIEKSQEYLGERARALMTLSRRQSLEYLLRSSDAAELELRQYLLGAVAAADIALIQRTVEQKETLEGMKTEREEVLSRLVAEERRLAAARSSVQQKVGSLARAQQQITRQTASKEEARRQTQAMLGQIRARMNVIRDRLEQLANILPTPSRGSTARPTAAPNSNVFRPTGVTIPGVYIRTPHGSAVKAMAEGEVLSIQSLHGMGQTVIVGHGGRLTSVYANLSSVGVTVGQRIPRNGTLGRSGTSPYGDAVYFAVYKSGVAQDPMGYL